MGQTFQRVVIRTPKLRLPVPAELAQLLPGRMVSAVARRGKYLLFFCEDGCLIIHLGMTGYLQLLAGETTAGKHDHVDFVFAGGRVMRFHDPRKFGTVLWTTSDPLEHPLLSGIGPEPLGPDFHGAYLFAASRSRNVAVKLLIMNAAVVAGIGNIYANEALFRSGIHPARPAQSLDLEECGRLAETLKQVLEESITQGSTYRVAEDLVAYHPLQFHVYGRGGIACSMCGTSLKQTRLGNRSTVFCPRCQR